MLSGPFTIYVDLMHGTLDGVIRVAAIPHITIYRIPHGFVQNLMTDAELKQAGIYLLVDKNQRTVYVGQADSRDNGYGLLGRMLEKHSNPTIDEWTVGYALTSSTPHFFGATELNWLERFFYDKATKVGKYTVLNSNRPHASDVNFSTRTILSNYVEYAFFLLPYLVDCDVFVELNHKKTKFTPKKKTEGQTKPPHPIPTTYVKPITRLIGQSLLLHRASVDARAEGELIDEKRICVKAGSRISKKNMLPNQAKQNGANRLRSKLEESGVIKNRVFVSNYVFNSTSMAATVILGSSSSGLDKWTTSDGMTLGDKKKELEAQNSLSPDIVPSWSKKHHLTARGADAVGYPLEGNEYLVMSGSKVSDTVSDSLRMKKSLFSFRMDMEDQGAIKEGVLTVNIKFSSPSTAASIIAGTSLSGASWKEE